MQFRGGPPAVGKEEVELAIHRRVEGLEICK